MSDFADQWKIDGGVEERFIPSSPKRLLPYLAALSSARIPHRVEDGPDGSRYIVVAEAWAEGARAELVAYERANRGWPRGRGGESALLSLSVGELVCAMGVAAALVQFYLRTGPAEGADRLFDLGALDSARVGAGEWWRAVTALWLHADLGHVLGNAAVVFAFGAALTQLLGAGPAWAVILLSGVLGNLTEALAAGPGRHAIGASTATFGALGALGVLQTARAWRRCGDLRVVFSRTWLPLGAAAALLGWLGAGGSVDEVGPARGNVDVIGHALGFGWGMVLGLLCLPLLRRPLPWYVQALCGLLAAGLVAWCWHMAGA
jgi:membrane associated rhomboid family serine protease